MKWIFLIDNNFVIIDTADALTIISVPIKILVIGLNYAPEKTGIAIYTSQLAESLAARSVSVRVVAGNPYYPDWRLLRDFPAWFYSKRIENGVWVLRTPHYVPRDPSGFKRLVHHLSFAIAASFPAAWYGLVWRPDLVVNIAPSLASAPIGRFAAWLAGAKSWIHLQDLEVDAAVAAHLLSRRSITIGLARHLERLILRSFDYVSSISHEMLEKIKSKGVDPERLFELRNWADPTITPVTISPYSEKWEVGERLVALYSGTISNKQGLEVVLRAAKLLVGRTDILFVICGNGPTRGALEQAFQLPNVQFRDLQPIESLKDLLGLASVHLLPQLAEAADLVLPSKLANMLASGRPIVAAANPGTGLARELEGCGIVVEPGNPVAFAEAIEHLVDDKSAWTRAAQVAVERSTQRWEKQAVVDRFLAKVRSVLKAC